MAGNKLRAINAKSVTPQIVLESLHERLPRIKEVYIVAVMNDGDPEFYASGDLHGMGMAAIALQDLSLKYFRGEIEE